MRNRSIGINVRVNEKEKKKLQRNAKKSGLTLSAYLRKTGLGQKIYEIPDETNDSVIYTKEPTPIPIGVKPVKFSGEKEE